MERLSKPNAAFARHPVDELKRKSIQGGVVAVCAQGAKLVLQAVTMMLLARLLTAEDFGLQAMTAVLLSFVSLFKEAGLASATVQRLEVTQEQISTLFWINAVVGALLSVLTAVLAQAIVEFYAEPRLYWITVVSGMSFVFSGLAAQHQALIVREMRFVTLAKIDLVSLAVSSALGISMAFLEWHYWALVGMAVAGSVVSAAGVWLAHPWVPGRPRRKCGVKSMLHFGWMATCTNMIVFLAWNTDSILLGRFWGPDTLGLYGRASQLAMLPIHQLNTALTGVAFSALSRIQDDPERLAKSFLRGYFLLLSLTVPIIISYPLFGQEIVRVMLGEKWMRAAPIFSLLAPTALVFALANPLSLLVMSRGLVKRAFSMAATTTPLVIVGILLGLSRGPEGVALGYSLAMVLLIIPIAVWSIHGTRITLASLLTATQKPLLSGLVAGAIGFIVKITLGDMLAPIPYLVIGLSIVFGVYAWTLLIAFRQKSLYMDLLTDVFRRTRLSDR
jgi:O-antigen/teichoic acid export membrane protein